MDKKQKIFSYQAITATTLLGGPLAFLLMTFWNYRVFYPYADQFKDKRQLKFKLGVSVLIFLATLLSPLGANVQAAIAISTGVILGASQLWRGLISSYKEQGGETFKVGKEFMLMFLSAVIWVSGFIGVFYITYDTKSGARPSILEVLEFSINTRFDTEKYNALVKNFSTKEQEALGYIIKIDSVKGEEQAVLANKNADLWKNSINQIVTDLQNMNSQPTTISNKITKIREYTTLRQEQAKLIEDYVADGSNETFTKIKAISTKIEAKVSEM